MKKKKVNKMKNLKQPKVKVPRAIHMNFTAEERSNLAAMGPGDVNAKIHALIQMEKNRQHPRTKSEALAKWKLLIKEAQEKVKIAAQTRVRMIEMGFTEAELIASEDALDAPD